METILTIKDCTVIVYHNRELTENDLAVMEKMRFSELYHVGCLTGFEIVEGE